MPLHVLAVGTRMPTWINEGVREYSHRIPVQIGLTWHEIKAEPRNGNAPASHCMSREADRLRAALPENAWRVVLDERGHGPDTMQFAERFMHWQTLSRPTALIIGGPDGLDPVFKNEAHERLSLSKLTLPHSMVRLLLAEQLYRAWSVSVNHPYHRA